VVHHRILDVALVHLLDEFPNLLLSLAKVGLVEGSVLSLGAVKGVVLVLISEEGLLGFLLEGRLGVESLLGERFGIGRGVTDVDVVDYESPRVGRETRWSGSDSMRNVQLESGKAGRKDEQSMSSVMVQISKPTPPMGVRLLAGSRSSK
jgi:hypothetical protein